SSSPATTCGSSPTCGSCTCSTRRRASGSTIPDTTTEHTEELIAHLTRRTLVTAGTAAAAAGALTGPAFLEWAKAWAQAAPWKPEKNAQLSMLRWKYFVQAADDACTALLDAC